MSKHPPSTISLLIKPAGPDCNLRCNYCFYRQKLGMFQGSKNRRMSASLLEKLISQAMPVGRDLAMFSWQGGEPTLMGLDFFKRAVEFQQKYSVPGQIVTNALQTNGTLLNRKWGEFLAKHNFLVGLSIDGPASIHDHYRRDADKKGTHALIMRNLRVLQEEGVETNILTLLNDRNSQDPDRLYDFLLGTGIKFFQFIPCAEPGPGGSTAPYSVSPETYGNFLCRMFDLWMDSPMDISIRDFDDLLAMYQGHPPNTCMLQPYCGGYMLVEHNGDVYPCDFFVQPKWKIGDINESTLAELRFSDKMREFSVQKSMLSEKCRQCEWVNFCFGGCLKHRIGLGRSASEPSYYCESYRRLFEHSKSVLQSLSN